MDLLYKVKRGVWISLREVAREWLQHRGEVPADVLGPFRTRENTLSVYALDDARANIPRIVAAIAAKSNEGLVDTDCLVFQSALIDQLGIAREKNPGETPDSIANDWHWDLARLTVSQIVALATALIEQGEVEFVPEADLVAALKTAFSAGQIDVSNVHKKVRQQAGL